jgi:hypothetical protein
VTATLVAPAEPLALDDRGVRRRINLIWALMLFNVLPFTDASTIIPLPQRIAQVMTMGSLAACFLLLLTVNPRGAFRPNAFLGFYTVLVVLAVAASVRSNLGSDLRSARFVALVVVLWLLTPLWGRSDLLLLRLHRRSMMIVVASVLLGMCIAPGKAFSGEGRLEGTIWPIPATQVAHYSAVLAGITAILWMCRMVRRRHAVITIAISVVTLLLTHTRTGLIALIIGLVFATLSLFVSSRRARRAFTAAVLVVGLGTITLTPLLVTWLSRGQDSSQISDLTGRRRVWDALVEEPRPTFDRLLGSGVSNGSFDGLPIDNAWLATYYDQGFIGAGIVAASLLTLLIVAAFRPASPSRAVAVFLIAYCFTASFTEVGLGGATTYLLDLMIAASLLAHPPRRNPSAALAA